MYTQIKSSHYQRKKSGKERARGKEREKREERERKKGYFHGIVVSTGGGMSGRGRRGRVRRGGRRGLRGGGRRDAQLLVIEFARFRGGRGLGPAHGRPVKEVLGVLHVKQPVIA
jgi:hypothetical protein